MNRTRSAILLAGLTLLAGHGSGEEHTMDKLTTPNIVMIIAFRDFRDEEFAKPAATLKQAGATLIVASSQLGTAEGMLGLRIPVDKLIGDVQVEDYDAVVFVGGTGAQGYFKDPVAHRIAREAVAQGKVLGAICIAPVILAEAGVVAGKRATAFPSTQAALRKAGAIVAPRGAVTDGKLVTADGPASAQAFADKLAETLRK